MSENMMKGLVQFSLDKPLWTLKADLVLKLLVVPGN